MPRTKMFCTDQALHKAMEVFWQKGYHATSIQDLVDNLGINRASIYDTYGGKKMLFFKSLKLYFRIQTEKIEQHLDGQNNVHEGFRSLFHNAFNHEETECSNKGCFIVNVSTQLMPEDEDVRNLLKTNQNIIKQIFADFIVRTNKNVPISEASKKANLILALYQGIMVARKIESSQTDLQEEINQMLEVYTA